MADKKPDKKPSGGGSSAGGGGLDGHMFEMEIKIFLVVAFVVIIYLATGKFVLQELGYDQNSLTSGVTGTVNQGLSFFNWLFNTIVFLAVFMSLLFVLGSTYFKYKHKEIVTLYRMSLQKGFVASMSSTVTENKVAEKTAGADDKVSGDTIGKPVLNVSGENKRWEDIKKHMASMNPSDWRMAILEADILLYEMLDQMGYDGDTVADKLKVIESSDFNTLDLAWRAHKVRNTIAHEGASYELSYQQAQNTIELYQKVFEEFYFV